MLLKRTILTFLFTGLLLYVVLMLYCQDTASYYNFVNVIVFLTYTMVLLWSIGRKEEYYTYSRLGKCVFIYSLCAVCLYLDMSFHYTNNTFYWDFTDPYQYFLMNERMLENDIPFSEMPAYITSFHRRWGFDDWGANISQMLFLKIIPSRYFLFFTQIVLGAIGAMMFFNLCGKIMKKEYAYIASLSYSIASFSIFYYSSFRKESIMVFLVIFCYWLFYQYFPNKNKVFLLLASLAAMLLFFFRPAVSILILVGFFSYFAAEEWGSRKMIPLFVVVLIILALSASIISASADRYTAGGITENENYVDATPFSIAVSSIGVAIGPFPQLLFLDTIVASHLPLYGNGLLLKFLMFLYFWRGFIECIKERTAMVMPLYVFIVLEMVALAIMNDGLELRKSMPHIPIFYMATFWFISKYDENIETNADTSLRYIVPYIRTNYICILTACFVFLATFIWNSMR